MTTSRLQPHRGFNDDDFIATRPITITGRMIRTTVMTPMMMMLMTMSPEYNWHQTKRTTPHYPSDRTPTGNSSHRHRHTMRPKCDADSQGFAEIWAPKPRSICGLSNRGKAEIRIGKGGHYEENADDNQPTCCAHHKIPQNLQHVFYNNKKNKYTPQSSFQISISSHSTHTQVDDRITISIRCDLRMSKVRICLNFIDCEMTA